MFQGQQGGQRVWGVEIGGGWGGMEGRSVQEGGSYRGICILCLGNERCYRAASMEAMSRMTYRRKGSIQKCLWKAIMSVQVLSDKGLSDSDGTGNDM